jgi:lipopolysaccharide/colanic/teichoic acid biosynthesis glycosyltransferase
VSLYRRFGKRLLDVAVAVPVAAATAPALAVSALAVRATMGSPVIFRQTRPGLHGEPFELLKLRTMRDAVDVDGRPLSDAERLTTLGRFLRASSIDELPQLLNVIRGDMSLVGPRPLLMHYLERYTAEQARRHDVQPGITGHAQVSGRNALSWEQKFACDLWYVDHVGLAVDLQILAKTALKVVARTGIGQGAHPTMPEFMGAAASSTTASTKSSPTTKTTKNTTTRAA